ncbi:DUF2975 domain-containing protein [Clostridium sp. YIM B02500]|uniref:DUF2975 domain-containing protein n=1 Tax=Clostridium sp. YIM B02500 TaxID=2910681 RepID=UPI001EED28E0
MNIKQGSTTFLKVIIFLIGIAVFALCIIWLPGIAIKEPKAHPGDYSLYPLLGYAYGCCVAFSVALYQAFKLLTCIERNNAFSELSLKYLKVIKKCGLTIILFFLLGIITLKVISKISGDDPAGPISLSFMIILATSIITAIVNVLQKLLINILEGNCHNN